MAESFNNIKNDIKSLTKLIIHTYDVKGDFEEALVAQCNQTIILIDVAIKRNSTTEIDTVMSECFERYAEIIGMDSQFITSLFEEYVSTQDKS